MNTRWLLVLCLVFSGLTHAQSFTGVSVDCAKLKLKDARGVGDENALTHKFDFSGTCVLSVSGDGYNQTVKVFPVEAKGSWNPKEQQFEEAIHVIGGFKWNGKVIGGFMTSKFKCNDDPLATKAACNGFEHSNKTALEPLSWPYKQQGRPFLVGHTSPAEALALSAKHPKSKPFEQASIPPPKKKPPGLQSTEGMTPHVTIRAPKQGQVSNGATVHLDVAGTESLIHKYAVSAVVLEWQWAQVSERLPDRPVWKPKAMLSKLEWTGREGPIYFAAIDIPVSRFTEGSKWRVRARTAHPSVPATAWVEFSVVPLGASQ